MAYEKFGVADNAVGLINSGIGASTTTITLGTGEGALFPAGQQFIATLVQYTIPADPTSGIAKQEKILVTNRSGDILTVTRGYDGDTATTFLANDYLYLNVTSKVIEDIQDEVSRLENDKLNKSGMLRTALGFWKTLFTNGTGEETELTNGATGKVLTSNGTTSAPSWETPTVSITGLTEDTTGDMTADYIVKNNGTGLNTKIKVNKYMATDAEVIAGTNETKFVNPKQVKDNYGVIIFPSETTLKSIGSAYSHSSTTYTKVNEITINKAGTYRTYMEIAIANNSYTGYGKIYKNGVAIGTERSTGGGAQYPSVVGFNEDFTFNEGDLVQVYTRVNTVSSVYNPTFSIKGSIFLDGLPT